MCVDAIVTDTIFSKGGCATCVHGVPADVMVKETVEAGHEEVMSGNGTF